MRRSLLSTFWSRFALPLLLPGCLVSFNDYALGDPSATESTAGASAGGGGADEAGAGAAPLSVGLNMIDDFEDGDSAILKQQGRSGAWYVANDGKGMQTPRTTEEFLPTALTLARGGSQRGAHTYGGPFPTWGALIGTALASNGNEPVPYDVSAHQGLRFWVRSSATSPNAAQQVRLNLPTPGTNTGGGCTVCNDHFGADIPLTAKWAQISVAFSSLKQSGWGSPRLAKADLVHVVWLQFLFPANVSFDLWIDDVELY